MGLLLLVKQVKAELVKETELSRQSEIVVSIYTCIDVKNISSDMKGWDTLVLKDILKDIQKEDKGIDSLASLTERSVNVLLRHLMQESVKCQFSFLSSSCLLLCCLLIKSVSL